MRRNRSDKQLAALIKKGIRDHMELSNLDINVDVKHGEIILSGIVDVLSEKVYAGEIARKFVDSKRIENNITVATDGYIQDDDIARESRAVIRETKETANLDNIDVKVNRGTAHLIGRVDTLAEKEKAVKAVQKTRGVKDVVSHLKVGDIIKKDDATLTNEVKTALSGRPFSRPDINVTTKKGKVYLNGRVDTLGEVEIAEETAMGIEGVKKVFNRLKARKN